MSSPGIFALAMTLRAAASTSFAFTPWRIAAIAAFCASSTTLYRNSKSNPTRSCLFFRVGAVPNGLRRVRVMSHLYRQSAPQSTSSLLPSPSCRSVGGACGSAPRSPTAVIGVNGVPRPPARRTNAEIASDMSFSVSDSRIVATNILNARSATRTASRMFSTSLGSFTTRCDSTMPLCGTKFSFGPSVRSVSSSSSVSRFPSTATFFAPVLFSTATAASYVVSLCGRM